MRTRRSQSSSDLVPSKHQSVLLHEAVQGLEIQPTDVVVDGTLGAAGHAREIAQHLDKQGTFIGFDLDTDAIARAQDALHTSQANIFCIEANFRHLGTELTARGITTINKALFDLGWSGYQLDGGRGFSFLSDEPLLMTYTKGTGEDILTAAQIVNEWEEESIADIIFGWGEERYARKIAHAIVSRRATKPFEVSNDLAETIKLAVPSVYRFGRIHPATKTFQALRIAVNDELGALTDGMLAAWQLLASGGRIAVISFHSIEDRIVKQQFVAWEETGEGERITKKPIIASAEELSVNPRARSAKLRIIQKI